MKEELIPFEIKHIDSLGQGVSHHNGQICFIPKTLPGEKGEASVYKKSKKVQFAKTREIHSSSPDRISPECPHYQLCSGCSFLHTSYEKELEFKVNAAKFQFEKLGNFSYQIIPASKRFGYRNRIQLHYDKKSKKIGFINNIDHQILSVPDCKLPHSTIQEKITELYINNAWQKLCPSGSAKGHLEIQLKEKELFLSWNKPYAEGGFSQVNPEMNQKVLELIESRSSSLEIEQVVDLFGGNGNLSASLEKTRRWIVDRYQELPKAGQFELFLSENLFAKNIIRKLSDNLPKNFDLLILDPPRSGFKELGEFSEFFHYKNLFYLSCFYPTMIRDLRPLLENYTVEEIVFLDFFPGTHHLETLVFLQRK